MRPGPRRSISQVDIVDTAFGILAEKGFAGVSVRGVAAALGLTPTAMYTYFGSKSALLEAMVEELLRGLDLDGLADASTPWRDSVQTLAATLRARLDDHVGSLTLLTSGPLDGDRALALRESLIEGFERAGLELDDAARAQHAVLVHVVGWAALDAAARVGRDVAPPTGRPAAEPDDAAGAAGAAGAVDEAASTSPDASTAAAAARGAVQPSSVATLWVDSSRHARVEASAHLALDGGATGPASPFALALDRVLDGWLGASPQASTT